MFKGIAARHTLLVGLACWLTAMFLFACPAPASAVVREHYFRMLDSRQGLSQSSVTAFLQDAEGFIWVATQGDLHRFDGYRFQVLGDLLDSPGGGLPSFVQALAEDTQGRVLIGTVQDGIFVLDRRARTLAPLQDADGSGVPRGRIDALLAQAGAGVWVAGAQGVGRIAPDGRFVSVMGFDARSMPEVGTLGRTVAGLSLDADGRLWIASVHGLYRLDAVDGRAERVRATAVSAVLADAPEGVWIGTRQGVWRQSPGQQVFERVWPNDEVPDGDACCEVQAMARAPDGTLWFSVRFGQVWRMPAGGGDAVAVPINPWVDGMLAERGLPQLMIDRSGLLWLGGYARGVATTPSEGTPFRAVFDLDPGRDPLLGNFVRAISETPDGFLWLGTLGGLRRYDPLRDRFEDFNDALQAAQAPGEPFPIPSGVVADPAFGVWVSSDRGLFLLNPSTRQAERIGPPGMTVPPRLRNLIRARDGALWMGNGDQGLLHLEPGTGKWQAITPSPGVEGALQQARVTTLTEDSRGRLWVGGMLGVSVRDPRDGQFRTVVHDSARADSLGGNFVRTVRETRDGAIWVGGHFGLDQAIETQEGGWQFRHWLPERAQSDPVVYALAEDGEGRLWVSGNHGIRRIDRVGGEVLSYGMDAGLQDLEFNGDAVAVLRDGQLGFGGIRGLNLVDPGRVRASPYAPPVALTWTASGRAAPLARLESGGDVRMLQRQRVLTLGFAALDFAATESNLFSYRLEGFDTEFSPPAPKPSTTYTNLPAGQYLFRVRASNHDGVWSKQELAVPVHVLPPWWRSGWAWAVYGLFGMLLLAGLWHLRRLRDVQNRGLLRQIREREDRLKLSLWGAGDSFWDWDLRSDLIHRIGADILLHMPEEQQISMGDWRSHAIHSDDLPQVQQLMHDHLSGRSPAFESEHRIRNAHGEWIWVRARGKVVERDEDGHPLRVAGTARDITGSRLAERERRIAAEVVRSMNEAVAVIDLNFRFVSVNPAFSRITGYREQEVVGVSDSLLESKQQPPEFYRRVRDGMLVHGHWKGEVWLRRADGEEFLGWLEIGEVRDEAGTRTHFVIVVNDITDKKRAEQELRYLANYDTLTGLPNRSLLSERLARAVVRARRHESRVAVLFLDLDHFKLINDSLGHAAGDRILKAAAARLLGVVGNSDTVARLGGDEFTVVMEDVQDMAAVNAMAEAVIAAFGAPILADGHGDIVISPSIGISLYPEHAQVPTDLLKFADAAMYRAKERGRNTWQLYDESMDAEVRRRATMTAALRRALDRGELHLEFQPRQSLFDGRIGGVEALLRWNSEDFGAVPPSVFVPLAEDSGLILSIGEWVLQEACRQVCQWRAQGLDVGVAVNVSVLQLLRGNIPASVARVLAVTGMPASRLELELTESMVMANAEQTISILRELKRLGVSIAIDDFGTGYSSLIYLKRLPIDTLKIDKEFVGDLTHDPDDEAITATIISMAHSLGLTVIAEGVETPEQLDYLRDHGCDEIQGYLLARPMQAEECVRFLHAHGENPIDLPVG